MHFSYLVLFLQINSKNLRNAKIIRLKKPQKNTTQRAILYTELRNSFASSLWWASWAWQTDGLAPSVTDITEHLFTWAVTKGYGRPSYCSSRYCPSVLKGITSPSPSHCLLQFDIYWCRIMCFSPKDLVRAWLNQRQFHSKLGVTVKREPMENLYNYLVLHLQSTFLLFLFSSSWKAVVPFRGDFPHPLLPPQGLHMLDTTWKTD